MRDSVILLFNHPKERQKMIQILKLVLVITLLFSCSHTGHKKSLATLTNDSQTIIKSNLEFLASDELEGREATKHGARVAAQYIASQLKQYGVKPFGDSSTYFQNFKLQSSRYLTSSKLSITKNDEANTLTFIDNFVPFNTSEATTNSEVVYLGYGVTDSTYDYDDYAGIDVNGKTVVCISGAPSSDEEGFAESMRKKRWSRSTTKAKWAQKKGANGIIVLLSQRWIKRWNRMGKYYTGEDIDEVEEETSAGINAAWLDSTHTKNLFEIEDLTYSQLFDTLKSGYIKLGSNLGSASWEIFEETKIVDARNVVGIVEGTDKSVEKEFVTVGAHYDHEGIKGGQVYNGADDNGSGTVSILESARQVAAIKSNRRPIIYIFYTAEEKGLLGAYNFTKAFEQFDDVIVNINMDMVGREHEDSMFVVGSGKLSGEFFDIVEDANKETSNFVFDYTLDDENHPEKIYYRSDHWAFAKKGVPIVFVTDNHEEDYHKPTDDVEKINFLKLEKTARLTTQIAMKVANLDHKLIVDNANISGAVKAEEEKPSSSSN